MNDTETAQYDMFGRAETFGIHNTADFLTDDRAALILQKTTWKATTTTAWKTLEPRAASSKWA